MKDNIKFFGTEETETKPLYIEAGQLSFELFNGSLRNINFKNREILRGIAYVSRDKYWGNYDNKITNLEINKDNKNLPFICT